MKQVENLEGEVNYRLLKAKVAQQTLRRLDKNFKSFFKASQERKIYQAIKDSVVTLEKVFA